MAAAIGLYFSKMKENPEQRFLNDVKTKENVLKYYQYVLVFARQNALTGKESYILAMIAVESAGNTKAVGSVGERGLMQVMKGALSDVNALLGKDLKWDDLFNPPFGINAGVSYLAIQKKRLYGDLEKGIRAYNVGASRVIKNPDSGSDYLRKVLDWQKQFKDYDKGA